jgi:hypothetical protein
MVHGNREVKKGRQETKEGKKEIQRGRTEKEEQSVKTQTIDIQENKKKIIR